MAPLAPLTNYLTVAGIAFAPTALLAADLSGLAGLAADDFVLVPYALSQIGLGRTHGANLGSDLADNFLVYSRHDHPRGNRDIKRNALRRGYVDRVRVPDCEAQIVAVLGRAIADSRDDEGLA